MIFKRKPNTTAHWKPIMFEGTPLTYECSNCGHTSFWKEEKCGRCKAKMETDEERLTEEGVIG